MNKCGGVMAQTVIKNCLRRHLSLSAKVCSGAYEGEGKTYLHVLNKDDEMGLMIDGYSQMGFRLNNDMTVLGPMVIFARSVLAWNIKDISDVSEESLSLFKIIEPKLDILVLGTGDKVDNYNFFKDLIPFSRKYKVSLEILPTELACSTFNFLNCEGRSVAGAMIPPDKINYTDDDELQTKLRYQNLYKTE